MDYRSVSTDEPFSLDSEFDEYFCGFNDFPFFDSLEEMGNELTSSVANSSTIRAAVIEKGQNAVDSNTDEEKTKKLEKNRKLTKNEHERIEKKLEKFDPNQSISFIEIKKKFGNKLNHTELIQIAVFLSGLINVKVDRDAKRYLKVLIKWYDDNWDMVSPLLNSIELYDRKMQLINI